VAWRQTVLSAKGTSVAYDVEFPAFGALRIELGNRGGFVLRLDFPHGRNLTGVHAGNREWDALPAGSWPYQLLSGTGMFKSGVIRIEEGKTAVLQAEDD